METNLTEVYLDNSATTRCSERAKDLMVKVLMEDYGNPSSLHMKGVEAENYIKEAKKKIAKTLKVDEKEILFTSGGTESNNTALIGAALANKRAGNHIITTSIEHASVSAVAGYLEELGFRVTYLKVDADGIISLDELREAVCEDTILVSMMMVNNEIGAATEQKEAPAEVPKAAEKKAPAAAAKKQTNAKPVTGRTVRVDIEKLDALMNQVSELIIAKNSLVSISSNESGEYQIQSFHEQIEYLERITTNLHESVMKVRMVPIESVVN